MARLLRYRSQKATDRRRGLLARWWPALGTLALAACLYPPQAPPPASALPTKMVIDAPYDLTWDAVNKVMKDLGYIIVAQDPSHGIIETQGIAFTLYDADCGIVGTAVGKQVAQPAAGSSSVFNIYLKPAGDEATSVSIQANYSTPIQVPFHPQQNQVCVSSGRRENALLELFKEQAAKTHRPVFKPPSQ
ncbi:MAG TPA: hypothetical protein VKV28_07685 [Candidatus Binataceae bacterium]|nr:hypothetical protein [Candidatus Binataceae bacterium]